MNYLIMGLAVLSGALCVYALVNPTKPQAVAVGGLVLAVDVFLIAAGVGI